MTGASNGVWRQTAGHGPLLVLVHGTMDRSASFGRLVRLLEDHRTVVRYDRRGYGHSLDLGPATSYERQVDDLLEVIDAARQTDEQALVFGHSMGGTIALGAAARATDRIGGMVVYESPMPWMDWWPSDSAGAAAAASASSPADAAERFMRRMVGDDRWQRLPPSTRAARRAEGPTMLAELAQVRPPCPAPFDLADIEVPVLAAHGSLGAKHHAASARMMAERAPRGDLRVVEGAGHGVHLTHPRAVVDLVDELLSLR